jgi:hypothetical protein
MRFPPGAMTLNLRRSRWREFGFMLRELRHALLPPHGLVRTLRDWDEITAKLAEPPRRRCRYAFL